MKILKKVLFKIIFTLCIIFVVVWSLLPFYSVIIASVTPSGELPTSLFNLPGRLTMGFYEKVFFKERVTIWNALLDSFSIATLTTIIVVLVSICSGYSFSRWKLKGKGTMMLFLLVIRMVPPIMLVLPIFQMFNKLQLVDTVPGISLAQVPWNIPLGVWLMKSFYDSVPIELEEAAWVDGASIPRSLLSIVIPLVLPGIGVTVAFVFLSSYIEYLYGLTLSRINITVLSVKIAGYMTFHSIDFQSMAVSALISMIPMVILIMAMKKYLIRGLTFGAIKG